MTVGRTIVRYLEPWRMNISRTVRKRLPPLNEDKERHFPRENEARDTTASEELILNAVISEEVRQGPIKGLQERFGVQSGLPRSLDPYASSRILAPVLFKNIPVVHTHAVINALKLQLRAFPIQTLPWRPFLYPTGTGVGLTCEPSYALRSVINKLLRDLDRELSAEDMLTIRECQRRKIRMPLFTYQDPRETPGIIKRIDEAYPRGINLDGFSSLQLKIGPPQRVSCRWWFQADGAGQTIHKYD